MESRVARSFLSSELATAANSARGKETVKFASHRAWLCLFLFPCARLPKFALGASKRTAEQTELLSWAELSSCELLLWQRECCNGSSEAWAEHSRLADGHRDRRTDGRTGAENLFRSKEIHSSLSLGLLQPRHESRCISTCAGKVRSPQKFGLVWCNEIEAEILVEIAQLANGEL